MAMAPNDNPTMTANKTILFIENESVFCSAAPTKLLEALD
jgi:hypothetical protein